jgi:flagellar assembly protein FliH
MSSRLFSGGEVEVAPIDWRSAGGASSPRPAHPTGPVSAPEPNRGKDPEIEIQARVQAAFQRGVAEGDAAGSQRAAAQMTPILKNFSAITQELATAGKRARLESEQSMVQLAVAIARRVLRREIATDPEAILGLVRAGIDKVNTREMHRLRLAPVDADFVRQNRERLDLPQSVEIQADASLQPGGAVFETTRGELDASVSTQLEEIERGFADVMLRRQR